MWLTSILATAKCNSNLYPHFLGLIIYSCSKPMLVTVQWLRLFFLLSTNIIVLGHNKSLHNPSFIEGLPREDSEWRLKWPQRSRERYRELQELQQTAPEVEAGRDAKQGSPGPKEESPRAEQKSLEGKEESPEVKQVKISRTQARKNRLKQQDPKAYRAYQDNVNAANRRRRKERPSGYMKELEQKKEYFQRLQKEEPERYQKKLESYKEYCKKKRKAKDLEFLKRNAERQRKWKQGKMKDPEYRETELKKKKDWWQNRKAKASQEKQSMNVDRQREASTSIQSMVGPQIHFETSPAAFHQSSPSTAAKHQIPNLEALLKKHDFDEAFRQIGFPPSP